jgi:Flp pilus assembly protein TadD
VYFSRRRLSLLIPPLLGAILYGCAPKAPAVAEHLAILRFENLGADSSSDWMGRAFSEIIGAALAGIPNNFVIASSRIHALDNTLGVRPVSAPGISTERNAAILAGANRIGYGDYLVRGGKVEARLTIEDPATGRAAVLTATGGDIVSAATSLARSISPRATPFQTTNPEAVRRYISALETGDVATKVRDAQAAIAADPNFAPSYRILAEAKIQQQDREGALAAIDRALARGAALPADERARLELAAAGLRDDSAARQKALLNLANATPADAATWQTLAQTAYVRHDYPQAVAAYQKALQIQPNDVSVLNLLAYSQAFAGDMDGAIVSLRRYQSLRPAEANPLDSMGDIQLMYGHLREAEDLYLQADKKDRKLLGAGDLLKAATARLMTGDVAGASALARQFIAARTEMKDTAVPIREAEWQWISGNRQAAREQLLNFARGAETGPLRDVASQAYSELAMWNLAAGDRNVAAQFSLKASTLANSQASAGNAGFTRFLSQPSAPAAEWSSRADQLFRNAPQSRLKNLALAYALLFDRQVAAASAPLRRLYDNPEIDAGLPILLAWSLMESGHPDEAAPLLRFNPIPEYNGIGLYTPLYFPRFYELRSRLAAKAGRADEARTNLQLFEKLGGK